MKFLKRRRLCYLSAILVAPLLLWGVVLCVVPTGWARERLASELAEVTGQDVKIEGVSLSLLGRMRIQGLRMADSAKPDDPWLNAASASLDIHLLQMLGGCCRPADVELAGVQLRVLRRMDGTLELESLLKPSSSNSSSASTSAGEYERSIVFRIRDSALTLIDEPAGSRFEVAKVNGRAIWSATSASIEDLSGTINGGTFEFAAKLGREEGQPTYEAEARVRSLTLDAGLHELSYLVPVTAGAAETVDGRINLELAVKGTGFTLDQLKNTLQGHGTIRVEPINLDGSYFLREVEPFGRLPRAERIGAAHSSFSIAQGRITSDDLTIRAAGLPIVFSGYTDFDGNIDYRTNAELIKKRLPRGAKSLLGEIGIDGSKLAAIHIDGTIDQARVTFDHADVATTAKGLLKDKEKVRDIQNRLLEKVLR